MSNLDQPPKEENNIQQETPNFTPENPQDDSPSEQLRKKSQRDNKEIERINELNKELLLKEEGRTKKEKKKNKFFNPKIVKEIKEMTPRSPRSFSVGFFWGLLFAMKAGWDKWTGSKGGGGGGHSSSSSSHGHGH